MTPPPVLEVPPPPPDAAPSAPPPTPPARRRSWGRRIVKSLLFLGLLLGVIAAIAGGTAVFTYYQMAGTYDLTKVSQIPARSEVFDADGALLGRIENVNRAVVPLKDVSPWFRQAIVTREDERFYSHKGLDFQAIARAFVRDVSHHGGGRREGASTITQQLARNSFSLGAGRTIHRKLLEAMVAARMERTYSKDQILEAYVNRIYLGAGVYGIETAANRYFDKPAKELTLGEAAMLAGIVRSPNRNSPLKNLRGAQSERDSVLERMVFLGTITPEQAAAAKAETPRLGAAKPAVQQRDWLMDAVRARLDDLVGSDDSDLGGMRIYTTVDPRLQKVAERSVENWLDKVEHGRGYRHATRADWLKAHPPGEKRPAPAEGEVEASPDYLQAALLAVDNRTGAIRAMIGGRNYEESSFNRALFARRQVGSTFKPFVYAAAFARGLQPDQFVEDSPLRPDEIKDAPANWQPANSDGEYLGSQRVDLGLITSRNVMTIRIGEWTGRDAVYRLAQQAGVLDAKTPALPSMHLGAFETTVKAVVGAYTAFPNKGLVRTPYLIERIDAADGDTLYRAKHEAPRVLPEGAAQTANDLMERVFTEGTARSAAGMGLDVPAAGKTGTTNDYKDAWFIGYTTSLTCGVWVGLDKPQTIMAKGYGAALALPVWVEVMEAAAKAESKRRYPALALHVGPLAGSSVPRAVAVGAAPVMPLPPAFATQPGAGSGVSAVPPPLASNSAAAGPRPFVPPTDPGSQLIVDPKTGRVTGIDGSLGASREEQYRQQVQQAEIAERQRARLLPGGAVPRAEPVGLPPMDAPVRRAEAVSPARVGPLPRAEAVSPARVGPLPRVRLPGTATGEPQVRTRIITMPDGSQVIQRTTLDPLGQGR